METIRTWDWRHLLGAGPPPVEKATTAVSGLAATTTAHLREDVEHRLSAVPGSERRRLAVGRARAMSDPSRIRQNPGSNSHTRSVVLEPTPGPSTEPGPVTDPPEASEPNTDTQSVVLEPMSGPVKDSSSPADPMRDTQTSCSSRLLVHRGCSDSSAHGPGRRIKRHELPGRARAKAQGRDEARPHGSPVVTELDQDGGCVAWPPFSLSPSSFGASG